MAASARYNWADPLSYPILKDNASLLKKNPTEAEQAMWNMLRRKQVGALFRRQYIIDQYIVDFVCLREKLIIEIDGAYHFTEEQQKEDFVREQRLSALGFRILRFRNEEVFFAPNQVVEKIKETLKIL